MTTDRFRSVAHVLANHISGTYALLEATDAVVALDPPAAASSYPLAIPHDVLVAAGLGTSSVMFAVRQGKRINAIKALRSVASGIGLKAAKEAIEDERINAYFDLDNWTVPQGDPWAMPQECSDEPPF
jgi:ribosomal protein L7/L12